MIGDDALVEILSKQPHRLRKQWLKDRTEKKRGVNVSDRNLKVSKMIDRLNKRIGG